MLTTPTAGEGKNYCYDIDVGTDTPIYQTNTSSFALSRYACTFALIISSYFLFDKKSTIANGEISDLSITESPANNVIKWPSTALVNESVAFGCKLEQSSVSFASTIMNTCKSLLGTGIVTLPMIFADTSLIPGIILLTMASVTSAFAFWCIGVYAFVYIAVHTTNE